MSMPRCMPARVGAGVVVRVGSSDAPLDRPAPVRGVGGCRRRAANAGDHHCGTSILFPESISTGSLLALVGELATLARHLALGQAGARFCFQSAPANAELAAEEVWLLVLALFISDLPW